MDVGGGPRRSPRVAGEGRADLGRSATVMAAGTALSRLTGLGRLMALTFALGVAESRLADAYNIANTLPNVLYELVLGGVLSSIFIPVVVEELRTKPRRQAWEGVSALATSAVAVLGLVTVAAVVAAPWIVGLFTSRLSEADAARQQELATYFLRVFAPQIALYGVAAIAAGLLNAHNRFAVPMFAPVLNNLLVIAALLGFAALTTGVPTIEAVEADPTLKLLLGLGTTAGVAAMALAHLPALRNLPGRWRLRARFRHPAVAKLARLSGWTLGYVVTNQVGFTVVVVLANAVQGGPTAYFTAFAFFQLPYGVAAVSVMTALVPTLAAHHVAREGDAFRARVAGGLRAMGLLMVPATAGFLVLSRPLIALLLERGVMQPSSGALVASVLDMFALGLWPFAAFLWLLRSFYARQDARTPMLVNLVAQAFYVVAAIVLFEVADIPGLALAHTLSYLLAAVLAGRALSWRLRGLEGPRNLQDGVKVVVATAFASVFMVTSVALVGTVVGPGNLRSLLQLGLGGGSGAVAYLAATRRMGVAEVGMLTRLLPARLGGLAGGRQSRRPGARR